MDQLKILKDTVATLDATIGMLTRQKQEATRQIKRLEGSDLPIARKGREQTLKVLANRRKQMIKRA